MRCQRCGYSNSENHKFCGMCGLRLQQPASAVATNDNPLDFKLQAYTLDDSNIATEDSRALWERDQRRESLRDIARASNARNLPRSSSPAALQNLPADTAQEEMEQERRGRASSPGDVGIGGPSFLGLNYESAGNSGFVYDKPKKDGFIYDTDTETPEYLLEEVPRGISWRAWALFALLLVAAGLGYVQWRASHHQRPDIASILAGNGSTVDPSAPVIDNKSSTPVPKQNRPDSSSSQANSEDSTDDATASESRGANALTSGSTEQKTANAKPAEDKTDEEAASNSGSGDEVPTKAGAADTNEAAKPESSRAAAKPAKLKQAETTAVEEAPQPKSLGDKDPLIVQAEKYLQGRGVRQNCSTGVNLLRQASSAGNPTADVKIGALYWSGTCVTQSNVTAYQWFSRAHALEPRNRWIERSRSSLWAGMSPEEKRRASF